MYILDKCDVYEYNLPVHQGFPMIGNLFSILLLNSPRQKVFAVNVRKIFYVKKTLFEIPLKTEENKFESGRICLKHSLKLSKVVEMLCRIFGRKKSNQFKIIIGKIVSVLGKPTVHFGKTR